MPYTVLQSAAEGGHKSIVRLFCAPEHGLAQIGQRITDNDLAKERLPNAYCVC